MDITRDVILMTSSFWLADYGLNKIRYFQRDNSRWFLMHTIANTYIVWYTFNDMLSLIINPLLDINMYVNKPSFMVLSLHLYHIIRFFKKLTIDDWWHHILNCFLVLGLVWYYEFGIIVNYFIFYMCGLPGGIDYLLLTLNEIGIIYRLTEKRINKYLNMWIRLPGILYGCMIGYIGYHQGYMNQYTN
jgi:hypothetical protein